MLDDIWNGNSDIKISRVNQSGDESKENKRSIQIHLYSAVF